MMSSNHQEPNQNLVQDYCESKLLVVPPNTLLSEAIALMSHDRHSCILIESQHQIKGIFTERDLIKLIASARDFAQLTIAEVMSQQPIILDIRENLTPTVIFSRLKQHKIRHLPVVDAQGKALGVITPNSLRQALDGGYLLKHRQVEEVMQRQVIYASGDRSISDMAQLMATHKISCVVIVETNSSGELFPIGIITERDLVQFKALNLDLYHLPVSEVMSSPLFPIAPKATLQEAHELMSCHHFRRLVVADDQGYLLGIITQTSILQNLESQEAAKVVRFLEDLVRQKTQQLAVNKELEQKQQRQLNLYRHRLEAILAATSDLVLIVAPQQNSVSVMAEDLAHSSLEQRNLVELTINQFNQPETSQTFYTQATQALEHQQKIEFEYSICLPDRQLWFVAQILPLPDDTVIWVARDLTLSKLTHRECQATQHKLEQLVAQRTQQLQSANQLLQNQIAYLSDDHFAPESNQSLSNSWLSRLIPLNNILGNCFERLQRLHFPLWTGAVVALIIALIIELCRRQGIIIPVPFMLLIITVSMTANLGGVLPGLWAHLVWSIYVIYAALAGFGPKTLTGGTVEVAAGIIVMGLVAIVQGWTKEQNRMLAKTLAYLNRNLEQQVRQRTCKLGLAYADLRREMKQHLVSKEALANSEQKFRAIFEHAGVGIAVSGLDKKLLQVNPKFCQFLGYSAAELTSMTFIQLTHPDDRQRDQHYVRQMRSSKIANLVKEKRYLHKDGSTVWGSLTAVTVKDAAHQPSYFVAVVEDITKRKQAELSLIESETQFVGLLNSCPFLVWIAGTDGMCNFFNTAWLTFTGRTLQQELGDGWCQGVHPEDLSLCLDTYQTAFARRERFSMEYRLRQRNGKYGWIYDEGIPKFKADGSFAGYIGTCVDISDRIKNKQEREKLLVKVEQERRFLNTVLQQMPAGVMIAEAPSGKIILSNSQASEIIREDELPEINTISDYDQVKTWNQEGKAKTTDELPIVKALVGEITSGEEVEILCGDGTKRSLFVNAAPIRDAQGQIMAAVGTFYDITEQKQAQAAKKEAATKSILLKEIHHRIKNNLQVVSSLLDLQTEQIHDRAAKLLLEKSQARIYTMALIHEKLYKTKNLDCIDFREYITSLCQYLHDSFIEDFKQINLYLEIDFAEISLDLATPCGLIINELVANALEHGFVGRSTGEIKVKFKKYEQNYCLCVQDNGCGLNFDLEKISKNTQFLGLSLVISLVEKQLQGTWQIKQNHGLVIQITFPSF